MMVSLSRFLSSLEHSGFGDDDGVGVAVGLRVGVGDGVGDGVGVGVGESVDGVGVGVASDFVPGVGRGVSVGLGEGIGADPPGALGVTRLLSSAGPAGGVEGLAKATFSRPGSRKMKLLTITMSMITIDNSIIKLSRTRRHCSLRLRFLSTYSFSSMILVPSRQLSLRGSTLTSGVPSATQNANKASA